ARKGSLIFPETVRRKQFPVRPQESEYQPCRARSRRSLFAATLIVPEKRRCASITRGPSLRQAQRNPVVAMRGFVHNLNRVHLQFDRDHLARALPAAGLTREFEHRQVERLPCLKWWNTFQLNGLQHPVGSLIAEQGGDF